MPADPVVSPADMPALRERFIDHAHEGNGTGCRCCALVDEGHLDALLAVGERDRRQIAQLTEAVEAAAWLAEFLTPEQRETYECGHGATVEDVCPEDCEAHTKMGQVAAVLADKEDAAPTTLERQVTVTICDDCSCQAKKITGGWSCPCCGDGATVREVTVTALVPVRAAGEGDT